MSDFYEQNDYRNYLQHHGIKGMHWGEQNGPPYPLSTKVHNMVIRGKQKRAAKRREKILNDPKKLYKHRKEFTKEEIDSALAKMESSERVRGKIKPTRGQLKRAQKKIEKERVKADKNLTKKMERYAANAQMLEQNVDKFTPEELRAALNRVQTKQNVFDAKMSELNRPKRYLDLGLGYVDTAINAVNKFKTIKNLFTPKYDEHGMTEQDRMNAKAMEYIQDLAEKDPKKAFAVTASNSNYVNNYTKLKESQNKLAKEEKKDKQSKQLEEQGNVIKEQKEDIRILRQENENLRSERDRAVANYAGVQNLNRINPQVIEYFDSTVEDARRNASDMNDWESYMERNSGGRAFDRINDRRAIRNSDISGDLDALIYSDISSIKMSDISSIFEENDKDFFLAHHGIKGQMWGVRNGPPYPLDQKTHNRVKKQKYSKTGSWIDMLDEYTYNTKAGNWYPSSRLHSLSTDLFKNNEDRIRVSMEDMTEAGSRRLPAHPKNKDFGKSVMSALENGQYITFDKSNYALDIDTIKKRNPMKMPQYFDDNNNDFLMNQLKKVNPGYQHDVGAKNNCTKCSATMTLMKMGYNQVQAGLSVSGSPSGAATNWFTGGVNKATNDLNDISKFLKDAPNGSFGMVGCGRVRNGMRTGGHQMSWTKTRNGKIRIEDGQDGRVYDSFEDAVKEMNFSSGTLATISDLTNAKPNWSALATDGVCQLPGNTMITDSFGDRHQMTTWLAEDLNQNAFSKPSISRSTYSVFNTPMSVAREWDPDLDRD